MYLSHFSPFAKLILLQLFSSYEYYKLTYNVFSSMLFSMCSRCFRCTMFYFFHILSFDRCSCSRCSVLLVTKAEECHCCQEIDRCAEIMAEIDQEGKCITLHPGFRDVCLNKYVLEVASLGLKAKSGKSYKTLLAQENRSKAE